MPSRKRARQITTTFHKLTRQREEHKEDPSERARIDEEIEALGGRATYQKASQVSTSFHSTSKWVLGTLHRNGWLYGIKEVDRRQRRQRRTTRILEVGAINTELLDAVDDESSSGGKRNISVRAIDLNSMHARIEEMDFLQLRLHPEERFDVIVNSMVLNSVPTPEQRGDMVSRLFHFLRPGGLVFVTLPRTCLIHSPYIDKPRFDALFANVFGMELVEGKESPKLYFWIWRRTEKEPSHDDSTYQLLRKIHQGKKYRVNFSVVLSSECIDGATIDWETGKKGSSCRPTKTT